MEYARIAIIAFVTFMIGGFWYSPAGFLGVWARENGKELSEVEKKDAEGGKHPALVFGIAYLASVVATYALSLYIGPTSTWLTGLGQGALVGFCFVAMSFAINYAFSNRSAKLWLVDAGYHVVQFASMGILLGLWH